MQASVVCDRAGCTIAMLQEWRRDGVVIPRTAKPGKGNHADYDDANLVAVAVAMKLKDFGVVVKGLTARFEEMHELLRSRSTLEWYGHLIVLSSTFLRVEPRSQFKVSEPILVTIDLDALLATLAPLGNIPQLPFRFGISSM